MVVVVVVVVMVVGGRGGVVCVCFLVGSFIHRHGGRLALFNGIQREKLGLSVWVEIPTERVMLNMLLYRQYGVRHSGHI